MIIRRAPSLPARGGGTIIAVLLVVVLGWLVVRTAVIGYADSIDRTLLEQIVPDHPALIINQRSVTSATTDSNDDQLRAATRFAPLSGRAASQIAAMASVDGEHGRALVMLVNARLRDPRNAVVRLQLIGEYLVAGRPDLSIMEADAAMRLQPAYIPRIAPLLPSIATTPAALQALRRAVRRNPLWNAKLLQSKQLYEISPALLFTIIDETSTTDRSQVQLLRQSGFLRKLVARGDIDTAFLAFANFLPRGARPSASLIYDGDFDGLAGPAPFNWDLIRGQVDSAEIESGNGADSYLHARFYSDRSVTLASQIIQLPAGVHRLRAIAASPNAPAPDVGRWVVRCLDKQGHSDGVLLVLPLDGLATDPRNYSASFLVPAAQCRAQTLSLSTVKSDTPDDETINVRQISIDGRDDS